MPQQLSWKIWSYYLNPILFVPFLLLFSVSSPVSPDFTMIQAQVNFFFFLSLFYFFTGERENAGKLEGERQAVSTSSREPNMGWIPGLPGPGAQLKAAA